MRTKRLLFAFFALLLGSGLSAQGIEFFHGSWEEALEKAKSEEKVIFVDAFAEWCGPCKRMASTVFPQEEVGAFFNRHFINMKIDMEKGMGLEFRKKYPVSAFPTLFFIDAKGEVVQKVRGAQKADGLISIGQAVLAKADNSEELAKAYEKGERDPDFVYKYVKALNKAGKSSLRVSNEYFDTDPDLSTEFNLRFLFEAATEADSKLFTMMLARRSQIEALVGRELMQAQIYRACQATVKKAIEFESAFLLDEAVSKMKEHYSERAGEFELEAQVDFYQEQGDADAYAKACKKYAKKVLEDDRDALYKLSGRMVKHYRSEPDVMKEAEKISETAADGSENYKHHVAYANILRINGEEDKARKAADRALKLAQKEGPMAIRMVEHMINQMKN